MLVVVAVVVAMVVAVVVAVVLAMVLLCGCDEDVTNSSSWCNCCWLWW